MASTFLRGRIWYIQTCENGRITQKSLRTKDKKVALYRKNEIENQMSRGDMPAAVSPVSVVQAFNEFKTSRENILTENSRETDHYRIQRFIDDEHLQLLRNINETSLKRHLDQRIKGGISNRTANHTIRALNTFLNFCIRKKYIYENPLRYMTKFPVDQTEPRFLSVSEVKVLLTAAKPSPHYLAILTAILTGMRFGELQRLQWDDIDFEANTITVARSKSKKFRKIPLHPDLRRELESAKRSGRCFDMGNYDSFDWRFKLIQEGAQMKYFRFHDLRHTFASLLIKSGVDLLTVSKLLGHSNTRTTEIYAHLYQTHTQDSIKLLANLLTV